MKSLINFILDKVFISLALRFKKYIVTDIGPSSLEKNCLLYFKTDPFFSKRLRNKYIHTNNEEIFSMVKILNNQGYKVDLVDREAPWTDILKLSNKKYDLLISNCAGNSAKYHNQIIKNFDFRKKVAFAAGPEPVESNQLVQKRYVEFENRNKFHQPAQRLVKGDSLEARFEKIDAIFYIGNDFSKKTFARYNIPSFRIYPSTSNNISISQCDIDLKNKKHFVYFGGDGVICKGLDLVLEAFDGLRDFELDICAPSVDLDFWNHYKPLLERNSQIRFHGFIEVGGQSFNDITKRAGFIFFPGSSEGCATSVVTCMRRGTIPVVTFETGIDLGDFGFLIDSVEINYLKELITKVSCIDNSDFQSRILKTIQESDKYTITSFEKSFHNALIAFQDQN